MAEKCIFCGLENCSCWSDAFKAGWRILGNGSDCLPAAQGHARGKDVRNMEKKGMVLVIAPDVMQKYFEGGDESKLGEVLEKCEKFPDSIKMVTPTSAFIRALKDSSSIDGARVKKFLQTCELADVGELKKAMGDKRAS